MYAYCGAEMRNECSLASSGSVRPLARIRRLAAHGACAGLVLAFGIILLHRWWPVSTPIHKAGIQAAVAPELKVLQDDWNERITRDTYWRSGRSNAPSAPPSQRGRSHLQGPPPPPAWFVPAPSSNSWFAQPQQPFWSVPADQGAINPRPRASSGYRTVCVRLCDGSFFPVSYGASESSFSRDQTTCSNTCPGSRLFYHKSSSDDPDDMVDVTGQSYTKLKNANLFRTQYVESCKCKPHPWEQEATDRHRIYALEDQRRRGNRAVVSELEDLRSKARVEKTSSRRQQQQQEKRKRKGVDEEAQLLLPAQPAATRTSLPAPRSDASRGQGGDRSASATQAQPPVREAALSGPAPRITTGSTEGGGTAPAGTGSAAGIGSAAGTGATPSADASVSAGIPAAIRPGSSATATPTVAMPSSPAETNPAPAPVLQPTPEKQRRKAKVTREARPPQRTRSADWVARTFNP